MKIALDEEERLQRERVRRKAKIIAHEIDRRRRMGFVIEKISGNVRIGSDVYHRQKPQSASKAFPSLNTKTVTIHLKNGIGGTIFSDWEIDNPPLYRTVHSEWSYEGVGFLFKFSLPSYAAENAGRAGRLSFRRRDMPWAGGESRPSTRRTVPALSGMDTVEQSFSPLKAGQR